MAEGYAAGGALTAAPRSWKESLTAAEGCVKETKFFDGVQYINACVEAFAKELGADAEAASKEPEKFVEELLPKLNDDQKASLKSIYEVRGDVITGLGAHKRAVSDYTCALAATGGEDASLKAKVAGAQKLAAGTKEDGKVPVTVLTGFLGAGKTTLLNRILKEHHGKRIAVIENEFGEVGIDDSLIEQPTLRGEENLVEMNNGCICCTVRGDLIAGLKKLVKNAKKKDKPLDGVIIETTGLADPAPVAQTFFADDFVQQKLSLDGILTVVDAKHLIQHLDEVKAEGVENEAVEQIAFADRILLNKCDLAEEAQLAEVERRIRLINKTVPIKRTTNSEVNMDYVLGIHGFSLDKIIEQDDAFLADDAHHEHDSRVSSVGIDVAGEVVQQKLNQWISWLLKERGVDMFRSKGVLAVKGMKQKFVFQAIHMLFANSMEGEWKEDEERRCKMIFIGKNLDRVELTQGFMACMAK